MDKYKCPKCDTEFSLGTKFCKKCGCNLEVEFIETPTYPKCRKIFPAGTAFCNVDGTKLVSPEQAIPKCVKCGTVYEDGRKFCNRDGGKVIPEALRTAVDFDNAKELIVENISKGKELIDKLSKNQKLGIFGGCIAALVLVMVFALSGSSPEKDGIKAAKRLYNCLNK